MISITSTMNQASHNVKCTTLKHDAICMNIEMPKSGSSTKMKDRRWTINLYNRVVSLTRV